MAINFTTLFTRLGKGFLLQKDVSDAMASTFPPDATNFAAEYDSSALTYRDIISSLPSSFAGFQLSAASMNSAVCGILQQTVIQAVADDVALESPDLPSSLAELVRQMGVSSQSVLTSTVSVTTSAITGHGDGVLVASAKRSDGLFCETAFPEAITILCTNDNNPDTAQFTAEGTTSESNPMAFDWPLGSGVAASITSTAAARSLLTNGNFDTATASSYLPDGWILSVGTPGTIRMSAYEVQQIAVTGGPSAGYYRINWTNPAGKAQSTLPIAYNATGGAVQAALRKLDGLSAVTVATSGASPNWTHVITFTGQAGNLNQVTVSNSTTGGTFTVTTNSDGDALAYRGRSVIFLCDGSELTTLNCPVSLAPLTQYAFSARFAVNAAPAAGILKVDLVDGIAGTVINDQASTANTFTIDPTALTPTFAAKSCVFRTPRILPPIVYLRIRISTAIDATTLLAVDEAALVAMQPLYPGGPSAVIFSGALPFTAGDVQDQPDQFTLTVANDRAGQLQQYCERNFGLAGLGLILPSAGSSPTLSDSLIG